MLRIKFLVTLVTVVAAVSGAEAKATSHLYGAVPVSGDRTLEFAYGEALVHCMLETIIPSREAGLSLSIMMRREWSAACRAEVSFIKVASNTLIHSRKDPTKSAQLEVGERLQTITNNGAELANVLAPRCGRHRKSYHPCCLPDITALATRLLEKRRRDDRRTMSGQRLSHCAYASRSLPEDSRV